MSEGYLLLSDQNKLYYRWERPDQKVIKTDIVIVHGAGEHLGRHETLAKFLIAKGYSVLRFDLRGAGKSTGLKGHVDRFSDYTTDLLAVIEEFYPNTKPVLLGHSLGGLIAATFAIQHSERISALVLSSPALALSMELPPWKKGLAKVLANLCPTLRMPNGIPLDKLAHDPEVARRYAADPLCYGKASTRWYQELVQTMPFTQANAKKITVPTLLMVGTSDAIVDHDSAQSFYMDLEVEDKKIVVYDGAYHEIFNDDCQEAAREDLAAWLDTRFS